MRKPPSKQRGPRARWAVVVVPLALVCACVAAWFGGCAGAPVTQRGEPRSPVAATASVGWGSAAASERAAARERAGSAEPGVRATTTVSGFDDGRDPSSAPGYRFFRDRVEARLVERCGACHLGARFAFAALEPLDGGERASQANYARLSSLLSLDQPERSRLLAKIVPEADPFAIPHRGDRVSDRDDTLYQLLLEWARVEKRERCSHCGMSAERAWIAYVEQPEVFWMIEREPVRVDRGERRGAKIMMQPVDPTTAKPAGERFDFLENVDFCASGDCDFGRLAINHAATQMAFECRLPVRGEPWLERSWNLCLADIGADGRAIRPRFLMPPEQRHRGWTATRVTPLGVRAGDAPGFYDKHFRSRQRNDRTPVFTPDDQRIVFSSQAPLPGATSSAVTTYHGDVFLEHIVSVNLEGGDRRVLYVNEGGTADLPFFLRNGNLAFHTWNLERMDRHMYVQALADGMMEMPVLGGRLQGPNMWGQAFESTDGVIIGLTGRRRGELDNYAPFAFDHTLGIETTYDPSGTPRGFHMLLEGYLDEIGDYPNGFCRRRGSSEPGPRQNNCVLSKLVLDPSYLPDGRALVAYNPERTYIGMGEMFALNYAGGRSVEERQQRARQYFPKHLGVGALDRAGQLSTLIENRAATLSRYPVWVGPRQPARVQRGSGGATGVRPLDDEHAPSVLHIADVPLWLSFGVNPNRRGSKQRDLQLLDRIVAVRVLRKVMERGACITDHPYVGMSNIDSSGLHPTALGLIDATGYEQYVVPSAHGGDRFGDVPLQADRSVRLRVPPRELVLIQGVDSEGNVVAQRNRVFALAAGHHVDSSVRREQYFAQCAGCHGTIAPESPIDGALSFEHLPTALDYATRAKAQPPVDLTRAKSRSLTFDRAVRPILDAKCVSCHQGERPAGGLSLQQQYSKSGNYPAEGYEQLMAQPRYLSFMREREKHRSHNFSVSYSWALAKAGAAYQQRYREAISSDAPLAELAPWDSGYQQLFRTDGKTLYYLSGDLRKTVFGRAYGRPSNAARSFLLEVLTGSDRDPTKSYQGSFDHRSLLEPVEVRTLQAVIDVGFPFMAHCDDKTIPSGPNRGQPWGEPIPRQP